MGVAESTELTAPSRAEVRERRAAGSAPRFTGGVAALCAVLFALSATWSTSVIWLDRLDVPLLYLLVAVTAGAVTAVGLTAGVPRALLFLVALLSGAVLVALGLVVVGASGAQGRVVASPQGDLRLVESGNALFQAEWTELEVEETDGLWAHRFTIGCLAFPDDVRDVRWVGPRRLRVDYRTPDSPFEVQLSEDGEPVGVSTYARGELWCPEAW